MMTDTLFLTDDSPTTNPAPHLGIAHDTVRRTGTPDPYLGLVLDTPPEWVDRAICSSVNPNLFFPEKGEDARYAKAICEVCPVQPQCRDYALLTGQKEGIWGGMSAREMARLRSPDQDQAGRRRSA